MKKSILVLSALLLAAAAGYAQSPAKPRSSIEDPPGQPPASIEDKARAPLATDNFNRVARIFGRDIFINDLNPTDDEFKMIKQGDERLSKSKSSSSYPFSPRSDEQIISEVRSGKLAGLIWDPIWAEFDRTHNVKPTETELDEFTKSMEAFTATRPDRQLADDPRISAKMKKESERRVAEHIVTQWKRNKALYETYGGIVLFQQLNPMEAFGAMRKLLESHAGDFEIYDDQLKQQFWKYHLREPISWKVIKPENIDYSVPWWLQKKPPDVGK